MPRIVQPSVMYTGLAEKCLPLVVVGVRVEQSAVRLGEYPSFVMPELTGSCTFSVLRFPVNMQQRDYRFW